MDKASEERFVAKRVNKPRNAFAVSINTPKSRSGEGGTAVPTGDVNAVVDIL